MKSIKTAIALTGGRSLNLLNVRPGHHQDTRFIEGPQLCWVLIMLFLGPCDKNSVHLLCFNCIFPALPSFSCTTLTIGALLDTSKYKQVSCSEPLGVTVTRTIS